MLTTTTVTPHPGSPDAIRAGCLCPVLDNGFGAGRLEADGTPLFWITAGCPLHAPITAPRP